MDEQPNVVANCDIGPGTEIAEFSVVQNCDLGANCQIWRFVNLYGCSLGEDCMVGSFTEIQSDVNIGDHCRIQTHAFVCSLVSIEDDVFVSHGAKFINDISPPSDNSDDWKDTVVRQSASIGTNATLLPVEVGENALVGAGAVVTEDVPENAIVAGNPAEIIGYQDE